MQKNWLEMTVHLHTYGVSIDMNHSRTCWICYNKDVDHTLELEYMEMNYAKDVRSFSAGRVIIKTPQYQCLCSVCGGNGVYRNEVQMVNDAIELYFGQYVLDLYKNEQTNI